MMSKEKTTLSIIPTIQEGERFIQFMNKKFELELPLNVVIQFHRQKKSILGNFTPNKHPNAFNRDKEQFHIITINTLYLKNGDPFETLAHELAHYVNEVRGIKDCSSNQYHNKHFKKMAETLLLKVDKHNTRGYATTSRTDEFNKLLEEFKPNTQVFEIFQNEQGKENGKQTTRNFLFTCGNNCYKIRCGDKTLNCVCGCGSIFREVLK